MVLILHNLIYVALISHLSSHFICQIPMKFVEEVWSS